MFGRCNSSESHPRAPKFASYKTPELQFRSVRQPYCFNIAFLESGVGCRAGNPGPTGVNWKMSGLMPAVGLESLGPCFLLWFAAEEEEVPSPLSLNLSTSKGSYNAGDQQWSLEQCNYSLMTR